jgi:hypothetical protein
MGKEQESNNLHLLYFINSIQSVKNDRKRIFNDGNLIVNEDYKKKTVDQESDNDDSKIEELDITGDNLDIEMFLKRFINAVIKPEMIEKLLNESI